MLYKFREYHFSGCVILLSVYTTLVFLLIYLLTQVVFHPPFPSFGFFQICVFKNSILKIFQHLHQMALWKSLAKRQCVTMQPTFTANLRHGAQMFLYISTPQIY